MAAKPDLSQLTVTQISELTGVSEKTALKRLRARAIQPVREDGRALYFAPQAALPVVLQVGEGLNPAAEKARLDRAKAELAELELAKRRRELLESGDVERGWSGMVLTWKERVRGVPAVATVRIPGFSKPMARLLLGMLDETLTELADGGSAEESRPRRTGKRKSARRRSAKGKRTPKTSA